MSAPPFHQAVELLVSFLATQGHQMSVIWVFREDLQMARSRVQVRWPVSAENDSFAREAYERARTRGLGVELRGVCRLADSACCYVWAPRDDTEAEYAFLPAGELKIALPTAFHDGEVVGASSWKLGNANSGTILGEVPSLAGG